MYLRLSFENLPAYNLQQGDKIFAIDEKVGLVGIVFIRRKDESRYVSGIYSCKTGELLLSEVEFDDIQVIQRSYGYHCSEFYYRIIKNGKVGACSMDGTLILEPENLDITEFVGGTLIVKTESKKYAAYSENGEELLPPKYTKMKRERGFIIAHCGNNVSVVYGGKVLAEEVPATRVTKACNYVVLHKEKSVILISVRGTVKEFEGTARSRQGDCIEISNGKNMGIVNALDGSYVIPMGEYRSIRKKEDTFVAEKNDGSNLIGKI